MITRRAECAPPASCHGALGERLGGRQVGERRDELVGPGRDLLVPLEHARERLARQHRELELALGHPRRQLLCGPGHEVGPGHAVGQLVAHGRRALEHEAHPSLLDRGDVLDEPAEAERAGRRAQTGLLVGEARGSG